MNLFRVVHVIKSLIFKIFLISSNNWIMSTNCPRAGMFTLFCKLIFQELMKQRIERKNGENCFSQEFFWQEF